jgi:hypothetical protein
MVRAAFLIVFVSVVGYGLLAVAQSSVHAHTQKLALVSGLG